MHSVNDCFHSNQLSFSIVSPRTTKKLICCNNLLRSHRQDAFHLQEQHSLPITITSYSYLLLSFFLPPQIPGTMSPIRTGSPDLYGESESLTRNRFVPFGRI
ncbi:hypothetical protein AVEN_153816-1 [Araneus ventricosus]|uniref:Uncharacterized protein n=1 Tax=Araneus ventricosus TaxID=182803 RepID=A0A4Y2LQQ5_ARAVE|nr:hypothetical protein AVEN_153816-1 [Araneus ventricosus]